MKKKTAKTVPKPATRTCQSKHRIKLEELKAFGEILHEGRESRQLSGLAISNLIGISQASWSRLESGEREPSLEVLRKIQQVIPIKRFLLNFLTHGSFGKNSEQSEP